MRKHAVVLTLTSLEIFALALLAFFWLVMRADLMTTYAISSGGGSSGTLPMATRIVLTTSVVPGTGFVGASLFACAWLFARGANARNKLLAASLVWTVLVLAAAIWAAYAPVFEHLADVSSPRFVIAER